MIFRAAPFILFPNSARRHGNRADSGGMAVDYRVG